MNAFNNSFGTKCWESILTLISWFNIISIIKNNFIIRYFCFKQFELFEWSHGPTMKNERKKGVLQLDLQLSFRVAMTTYNSMYFYILNVITQVAEVATHCIYDANHRICCNNSFPTTMQFSYDYNHNLVLTSFLSIHQNLTHGIMNFFGEFLFEILISIINYDYSFYMIFKLWHNQKLPHGILIEYCLYIYRKVDT